MTEDKLAEKIRKILEQRAIERARKKTLKKAEKPRTEEKEKKDEEGETTTYEIEFKFKKKEEDNEEA